MHQLNPKKVAELFQNYNNILILGHKNPDGDCIGSMVALQLMLQSQAKKAVCWLADLPSKYNFLSATITFDLPDLSGFDLVVCLDTPSKARVDFPLELIPQNIAWLSIDHHPVTASDFDFYLMDKSQAAAACIVYEIIQAANCQLTAEMATAIYTAILTDTGSFSNRNTDGKVFEIATAVVAAGADPATIANDIYNSSSATKIKLTGEVFKSLELFVEDQAAIMCLSAQTKADLDALDTDTEDLVTYARSIAGVRVAAFLNEDNTASNVKISLRSKDVTDDISVLAKSYGGGGHKCASGATVNEPLATFLPKFKEKLIAFTNTLIKE